MVAKISLEDQVKTLQKHMWAMVQMIKDLKCNVENLEKKIAITENSEIKEIIKTQQIMDGIITANSEAIKQIDEEIKEMTAKKFVNDVSNDTIEKKND
jgi:phage shock protein A